MNTPKLISSTWLIAGEIVTSFADGSMPPMPIDETLYTEDGWTIEMIQGCVGNKAVDEHLATMLVGDKYQKSVAEDAATRFAVILPDRDYDRATKVNLHRNYQQDNDSFVSGWGGKWMFEPFHAEMERLSSGQVKGVGDPLVAFATPIYGFNPNITYKNTAVEYIKYLNHAVAARRFAAENPNTPKPSPAGR